MALRAIDQCEKERKKEREKWQKESRECDRRKRGMKS